MHVRQKKKTYRSWDGHIDVAITDDYSIRSDSDCANGHPHNLFLTSIVDDIDGEPYGSWGSWKWINVNTTTGGHQDDPAVAMANDGRFVVTWQSYDQDGDDYGIFVRRYDGAGQPLAVGQ